MMKLKKVDYSILETLVTNSRIPFTSLGRKAHLSRENTTYRLNTLQKKRIIKSFNAVIDVGSFGFKQYALFLQIVSLNKQKEHEIIEYLRLHENISWIGILAGKWSIVLDIYAKDEKDLSVHLHHILSLFGTYIGEYALSPLEKKEYFINKIFNSQKHSKEIPTKIVPYEFDEIDLEILKLLNADARITYAELSKKIHLTANGIKKRIHNLESKNIIQGYTITIDHKSFGFEWYGIQLKLSKFDKNSVEQLTKFFREHSKVIFYYKYISGFWDFDIGILVRESSELRDFINELRGKFAETIRLDNFFLLLDEITNYTLPSALFKHN